MKEFKVVISKILKVKYWTFKEVWMAVYGDEFQRVKRLNEC